MYELYLHFPDSRKNFIIKPNQIVVAGRAWTCDLQLVHYFEKGNLSRISGQHFKIYKDKFGPHFFIIDTSRNGTEINGQPLEPDQPQKLKSGDILRLAKRDDFQIRIITNRESTIGTGYTNSPRPSGINLKNGQFFVDRKAIPDGYLAPRQKELLEYLYQKAGDVCLHEELIVNLCYGGEKALATAVNRLRNKLNQFSPGAKFYVQTVTKQGYRLQKAD